MSPLGVLLHAWRLRQLRRAMRTLNRQLDAYERAYGTGAFQLADEELRTAGQRRKAN